MRHKAQIYKNHSAFIKVNVAWLAIFMSLSIPVLAQETPAPTPIENNNLANDPAVTQIIDRLKNSTEQPVNLSDVSSAQDLIARIDLLSTLQEKMNKLEDLKQDKKKKSNEMAGLDNLSMPGALNAMPLPGAMGGSITAAPELELVSIQGSGNNLTAIVQLGTENFKVGPKNRTVRGYEVTEIKPSYIRVKHKGDKEAKQISLASSQ